jgi:hypothetical protein
VSAITIGVDIATIGTDQTAASYTNFVTSFSDDMAALLGITADRVRVDSVTGGSVIVGFTVTGPGVYGTNGDWTSQLTTVFESPGVTIAGLQTTSTISATDITTTTDACAAYSYAVSQSECENAAGGICAFTAGSPNTCNTEVDGCDNTDCGSGGVCTDATAPATGYTCACDVGYSGSDTTNAAAACFEIDGCAGVDCGADATCTDVPAPATGYTCACEAGFSGSSATSAAATCVDSKMVVVAALAIGAMVLCVGGLIAGIFCGWFASCKVCNKGTEYAPGWDQDVEATNYTTHMAQHVEHKDPPHQGNQGP